MKNSELVIKYQCAEDFSKMQKNGKGRFCENCNKTVHDFTKTSVIEIHETLTSSNEEICGHYYEEQINLPKSQWKRKLITWYSSLTNSQKNESFIFRYTVISLSLLLTVTGCHSRKRLTGMIGSVPKESHELNRNENFAMENVNDTVKTETKN